MRSLPYTELGSIQVLPALWPAQIPMKLTRAFGLVFFLGFGYGLGTHMMIPATICAGMTLMMVYADRKFKYEDAEWNRVQRAKLNLTADSESLIDIHECESACMINPATGLQVHD